MFDLAGALHREPGRARAGAAEPTDRVAATRQAVTSRRRPVVGPAGDESEREADAVAASVVRGLSSGAMGLDDGGRATRIRRAKAGAQPRVQRSPADFVNHSVLSIPPKKGRFRTSHWESIQDAVRRYSALTGQQVPERRALLRELSTYIARWTDARGLNADKSYNDLDEDERSKWLALSSLKQLIDFEYRTFRDPEMKGSSGELEVEGTRHVPVNNPALTRPREAEDKRKRGFLKSSVQLLDEAGRPQRVAVPARSVCRVIVKETGPGGKSATDYYWIRPAPTEDFRFGPVPEFSPGFVERSAVIVAELERDDPGLMYEKRFSPIQFPLFQGPPRVEDVQQVSLGDCYLLAAVLAIVRRDPTFFVTAMKDHGDGVVSVRLYDIKTEDPPKSSENDAGDEGKKAPTRTFRPRTINVEKSVVVQKNPPTVLAEGYNKGATWVQILEKAYAAAGYTGSQTETLPSKTMTWSQIASGHARVALEHLTGAPAEDIDVKTSEYGRNKEGQTWASTSPALREWLKNADPTNVRFMAWFAQGGNTKFEKALVELHDAHDEVRKSEVFTLLDSTVVDAALRQDVKNFIDHVKLYPGRRGSGNDTASQVSLFTTIATALGANKRVVLESKKSMKRAGGDKTGKSAGEHKHEGLAGPHGYEVIDFRPADFVQNPRPGVLLWLKVRNPWGEYGRKYVDKATNTEIAGGDTTLRTHGMKAVKDEDQGEFWIPLSDVTKRFDKVVVQ